MTLRLTTLCTLLVGSVTTAQATVPQLLITRVDDPASSTFTFGVSQCSDTVTLRWQNTFTNLFQCGIYPLKLWSTAGECGSAAVAGDTLYTEVPGQTLLNPGQANFEVKIAELPDFKNTTTADGGTLRACGSAEAFTKTHKVCGSIDYAFNTGLGCGMIQQQRATAFSLVYDTQPPSAPTITESAAQDEGVRVKFTVDSDTAVVILEVQGPTDADFRQLAETASTSQSVRGDGLENNVSYKVRLRARDAAGNVSLPTAEITVVPIRTVGFWGYYKDAGGTDQGCSAGAGLMPLLFAALAFRRARKQVRRQLP